MARTSYVNIPPGLEEVYYKALKIGDRYTFPRMTKNKTIISRKRRKGFSRKSLLPQVAEAWHALTEEQQEAWTTAASYSGMRGYTLFVKDKCYRIINDIEGNATPSILHQALVGELRIDAPEEEIKIFQAHPESYWISKPVYGKKGMRTQVMINEHLELPLTISLNYKADLTSTGEGSFAKYYAIVKRLYQGRTIDVELAVNLDLQTDWKNAEATLESVVGQNTNYGLYIHLYKVTGSLLIDNVKAEHSSQNWVRDTYCNDIRQGFTKAFYQIPKHWVGQIIPGDVNFDSRYPED